MNQKEKFHERQFIITSIIRLLCMVDFGDDTLNHMKHAAEIVHMIEDAGGSVTETGLWNLYVELSEKEGD